MITLDIEAGEMILDNVAQFWSLCHETIDQCATAEEWSEVMTPHLQLLEGHSDLQHVQECGGFVAMYNDYY